MPDSDIEELRKLLTDPKVTELIQHLQNPEFIKQLDRIQQIEKTSENDKELMDTKKLREFVEANFPVDKVQIALKVAEYGLKWAEYTIKFEKYLSLRKYLF